MSLKHKLSWLVSLILFAGVVYAQQAAQAPPQPPAELVPATPPAPPAALLQEPWGNSFSFFLDGGSFLGVYAEDIDREKMGSYGLREPRGVGITNVVNASPAEKAGLRKGDVILRFDGENVTSVRKLNRLVSEVAPDQSVRILISRGGAEQEVAVTMAERTDFKDTVMTFPRGRGWKIEGPDNDSFVFSFGNGRRIGINTVSLTKQLADYFGVADGKGVLVTSVTPDGAAAKAGIKAGDVITAVGGEKVESSGDLSRAINQKKEGDVTLTVIRDKSQRTFTVTPSKANPARLGGPGHVGTRVVVPRIEIPAIPEVNIKMPRIEIPAIPEININVDLPDRIRRGRIGVAGPI
jgi:serine protease Do